MAHISTSTVRIVAVDAQHNRVKLSNQRTVGFVAARLLGLDPEDFQARQGAAPQRPLSASQRPSGRYVLAGGQVAYVDASTGRAELQVCPHFVRMPSLNPEPDCEADCWTDVQCEGKLYVHPVYPTLEEAWVCEYGHEYAGLENELGAYGLEWEREQAIRDGDYF